MSLITLPSGVLAFDPNRFQSGNSYQANPAGTIIRNTSTADFSYTATLDGRQDVSIQGVVFDGNGISLSNTANVALSGCRIQNARRVKQNHQGIVGGGNHNLRLTAVKWVNCTAATMLYHNAQGLTL